MLKVEGFSQKYNEKVVVKDLNLEVMDGEIFGFIGHNGAGKSTTIKSIVGILPVETGEIYVNEMPITTNRKACQQISAYIPDNPDLYEYMTGIDYINFIADIFKVPEEERVEKIKKYGDAFEITDQLGDLISSYSHGMKQKVALIGAFVHSPKLLVLDEPFVGLDPKASAVLKQSMRELCDQGSAIFFSTHVLETAQFLCDRVGMIDHGHLILTGVVSELTKDKTLEEVFLENLEAQKHMEEKNA